jgi:hypothetical protein
MEVQFCFHKRGERDVFRSFEHLPLPAVGTVIIFGQQTWRVTDVTYDFDHQRIDVIAAVH